jgi:hypothetical protein
MMSQPSRILSSWIAIVAILLNVLVPTVSVALEKVRPGQSGSGSDWIEVCSTQGSTWARLGNDGAVLEKTGKKPADAPASAHGGHCPYCLTHAASFALPPAPAWETPVNPATFDYSLKDEPLAFSSVKWLAPAVRAPPFSPA